MKYAAAALLCTLTVAGCATSDVEPIPGSITYTGQPRTKLTKSPVGSTFSHEFYDNGREAIETYRIEPDRSLKLIRREWRPILDDR